MNIWILDKDPEGIKPVEDFENEIIGLKYYNPNYNTIVEKTIEAILSHAHEIDIDELNRAICDAVYAKHFAWYELMKIIEGITSQFLQEKLNQPDDCYADGSKIGELPF